MKSLFNTETSIQAILYIVNRIEGKKDFHKIFKILYFADQMHLSKYARSITGDEYIAMNYGPVPSKIDDICKALRGESFFSDKVDQFKEYLEVRNNFLLEAKKDADMDYLSESDIECLDFAIEKCKNKSFDDLVNMSHGEAWHNTNQNRTISTKDIMREYGEAEEYVNFVHEKLKEEACFLH